MERAGSLEKLGRERRRQKMRDQVLWRKEGRIVALLAERLNIDTEKALDILYNSYIQAAY